MSIFDSITKKIDETFEPGPKGNSGVFGAISKVTQKEKRKTGSIFGQFYKGGKDVEISLPSTGETRDQKIERYKIESDKLKKKSDYLQSDLGIAAETVKGIPKATGEVAQSVARGFAAGGLEIAKQANKIAGREILPETIDNTGTDAGAKVGRFLYGDKPFGSFEEESGGKFFTELASKGLKKVGVEFDPESEVGKKIQYAVGFALTFAPTPEGKGAGMIDDVVKKSAPLLLKETEEAVVKDGLKAMGIADDVASKYAPDIAKNTTDEAAIQSTIKKAINETPDWKPTQPKAIKEPTQEVKLHTPIKQVADRKIPTKTVKTIYGKKPMVGTYKGSEYVTDTFMLEFKNDGGLKHLDDIRSAPTEDMIETLVKRIESNSDTLTSPVGVIKSGPYDAVVFSNGIALDAQRYNYFASKYKNLKLVASETTPNGPIAVFDGNELKGMVMPINEKDALNKPDFQALRPQSKPNIPTKTPEEAAIENNFKPTVKSISENEVEIQLPKEKKPSITNQLPPETPPDIVAETAMKELDGVTPQANDPETFKRFGNATNEIFHKQKNGFMSKAAAFERTFSDAKRGLLRTERQTGLTEVERSPYVASELAQNKIKYRIDEIETKMKDYTLNLEKANSIYGLTNKNQFRSEVYEYAIAKHAPDRNRALGKISAGSMTDEEAMATIARLKEKPYFGEIEKQAKALSDMAKSQLDILLEGKLITQEFYDDLRLKYGDNYIPLNRIMDEEDTIDEFLTFGKSDVYSSGIKKAKGESEKEVSDIIGNVMFNLEQATIKAEKNIVNNIVGEFAENEGKALGIFSEFKPRAIGEKWAKADEEGRSLLFKTLSPDEQKSVLTYFKDGKKVYLKIDDPIMADMIKDVTITGGDLKPVIAAIRTYTNFIGQMAVRFNPAFTAANMVRDSFELAIYLNSRKDLGVTGLQALNPVMRKEAMSDIIRYMKGAEGTMYETMLKNGGMPGSIASQTRAQKLVTADEWIKMSNLSKTNPKLWAKKYAEMMDAANEVVEASARMIAFKLAKKKGLSDTAAAHIAYESTVPFGRRGQAGSIMNAMYLFSNTAIQSSVKFVRAMSNPKTAATVVTSLTMAGYAVNKWNDTIDPSWREKSSEWERNSSVVILIPTDDGDFRRVTIPMPHSIRPIKALIDIGYEAQFTNNTMDWEETASKIMNSFINVYNPLGGTTLMQAVTPTIGDIPVDLYSNKTWADVPIKPTTGVELKSNQYYGSLENKMLGKVLIDVTKWASDKYRIEVSPADINYGIEQLFSGTGKFFMRTAELINDLVSGEGIDKGELPFVSTFFKETSKEDITERSMTKKAYDKLDESKKEEERLRRQAEDIVSKARNAATKTEALGYLKQAEGNDALKAQIEKVLEAEAKGYNSFDKAINQMSVKDGERAQFLAEQFQSMSPEEAGKLYADLRQKKLISDEVAKQLSEILSQ